jgi:acetylornithine deacetylase
VESNRLEDDVPLSVPTVATLRVYLQFLPDEDVTSLLSEVQESLHEFARADLFFRDHAIEWLPLYHPPLLGHELAADHPWTVCMAASAKHVTCRPPEISAAPYPCDAFLMQREFGIPTLLFGPCGAGAHNPDEYADVKSTVKTAEALLAAALLWCN